MLPYTRAFYLGGEATRVEKIFEEALENFGRFFLTSAEVFTKDAIKSWYFLWTKRGLSVNNGRKTLGGEIPPELFVTLAKEAFRSQSPGNLAKLREALERNREA